MNEQESKILDMLRHYWYVPGIIDNKRLDYAISKVIQGKNPFLVKDFLNAMIIKADSIDYKLSSEAFTMKLENDEKGKDNREKYYRERYPLQNMEYYHDLTSNRLIVAHVNDPSDPKTEWSAYENDIEGFPNLSILWEVLSHGYKIKREEAEKLFPNFKKYQFRY